MTVQSATLSLFLSYPKQTFSREQPRDEFWDMESDTSLRAADVYVTKLRVGLR